MLLVCYSTTMNLLQLVSKYRLAKNPVIGLLLKFFSLNDVLLSTVSLLAEISVAGLRQTSKAIVLRLNSDAHSVTMISFVHAYAYSAMMFCLWTKNTT